MKRDAAMALYKRIEDLRASNDPAFDREYQPNAKPGYAGIYRCTACGTEVVGLRALTLPSENHHAHDKGLGPIAWRLAVAAQG